MCTQSRWTQATWVLHRFTHTTDFHATASATSEAQTFWVHFEVPVHGLHHWASQPSELEVSSLRFQLCEWKTSRYWQAVEQSYQMSWKPMELPWENSTWTWASMTDPKRKRQLISETASSFPKQNAYTPFRMMNTGINNHIYSQGMLDKHRHSPIKSDKEAKKTVSGCTMKWQGW